SRRLGDRVLVGDQHEIQRTSRAEHDIAGRTDLIEVVATVAGKVGLQAPDGQLGQREVQRRARRPARGQYEIQAGRQVEALGDRILRGSNGDGVDRVQIGKSRAA